MRLVMPTLMNHDLIANAVSLPVAKFSKEAGRVRRCVTPVIRRQGAVQIETAFIFWSLADVDRRQKRSGCAFGAVDAFRGRRWKSSEAVVQLELMRLN